MENNWNPRYVLYAAHEGRTPEQQVAHDDTRWPGGCMTGYICWIQEHAGKFRRAHPEHCVGGGIANQDAFTKYLANVASARVLCA